ncbi:TlpA family protein disulfide reductase [Flavobacterium tegetincola]|uniref:TlpA family protein disulfide reductase n=1 Tax=Flavobacterium tegetincola TaxID=150172 RepID=UPI0005532585|nr:TlpA disulfide reductase family protein [Flavobacterium tegetincola]
MKIKLYLTVLLSTFNGLFYSPNISAQVAAEPVNQDIRVYNFDELEPLLYTNSSKTYIVNFWAMWCGPCIMEMPYFQEYVNQHPEVELLFVSLDFPKDIEKKLKPFLKKKGITAKVVLLDDADANHWIDEIDPNWSGALPFTIIFNNTNRTYHERSFESLEELEIEIHKTIN